MGVEKELKEEVLADKKSGINIFIRSLGCTLFSSWDSLWPWLSSREECASISKALPALQTKWFGGRWYKDYLPSGHNQEDLRC